MKLTLPPLIIATLIISGCNEEAVTDEFSEDTPPLLSAAEQGDLGRLDALLATQADVDQRDFCAWTPLMKAALNGHAEAVQRLLDAGARVQLGDKGGYTALMLAASNNHVKVVELLLKGGADINHTEKTQGWTALIWAAKRGHIETVQMLLNANANPSPRDYKGLSAATWARQEGYDKLAQLIDETGNSSL